MKKIFLLPILIFLAFILSSQSHSYAEQSKITYPVKELANCQNAKECKLYCDIPTNYTACQNFAKSQGLVSTKTNSEKLLDQAKKELQCTTTESCKQFCSQTENYETCSSVAKKLNLPGGYIKDPNETSILRKAKEVLNCTTPTACKNLCAQEAYQLVCTEFAQEVGLKGGAYQAKIYEGPKASSAYDNADDKARFCREFPEKCNLTSSPTPKPSPSTKSEKSETPKATKSSSPSSTASNESSASPSPSPSKTPSPSPSKSPSPSPSPSPSLTSTPTPSPSPTSTSDTSFCNDSDENPSANVYITAGTCTDATGTYTDYCDGGTVKEYYCTGTWNGTSWSNRRCALGGYVCTSSGKTCSAGACIEGSVQSAQTQNKPTLLQSFMNTLKKLF